MRRVKLSPARPAIPIKPALAVLSVNGAISSIGISVARRTMGEDLSTAIILRFSLAQMSCRTDAIAHTVASSADLQDRRLAELSQRIPMLIQLLVG